MSGPLSPSCWMSVVRLTDIFFGERERVGDGEGVGWRTQEWLRGDGATEKKGGILSSNSFKHQNSANI